MGVINMQQLLINNNFIFSQNIEKIKKSDTLYIYFESKNNTYDQVMDKKTYAFNYLNNFGHYNTLWFYVKSNSNILSLKRRRFFKKNKDVIVNYNFLNKLSFKDATFLFDNKIVFLINKEEMNWNYLKLNEVNVCGYSELSIE